MPQATQTNRTLASGFTEAAFITALQAALTAAGFPAAFDIQLSTATGTNRYMVFQFAGDTTKAKGYIYLRIRWTWSTTTPRTATLFYALFDTWDKATRTGTNMGAEYQCAITPQNNVALDFYSFSHPEVKHVVMNQGGVGGTWGFLNFLKPANKAVMNGIVFYDEATYPYGFTSWASDMNFLVGAGSAVSPTNEVDYQVKDVPLKVLTSLTNRIQRDPAPEIYAVSGQGIVAQFSSDVGICSSFGAPWLAEINDGSRHVLLSARNQAGMTLLVNPTIVYQ